MSHDSAKLSKIDCFLISNIFVQIWPNSNVIALPKIHWDHCPLLLDTNSPDYSVSPFRFFNSWLQEDTLLNIVKKTWDNDHRGFHVFSKIERMSRKLRSLKDAPRNWCITVNEEKGKEIEKLKKKVVAIDIIAETILIDHDTLRDKAECIMRIQNFQSNYILDIRKKIRV